jgi:hypothetical protein
MKKSLIKPLVIFFAACAVFALLYFRSPDLMENDSYFHTKMGQIVMAKGLIHEFPWMQFTFQKDHYANPYLLFHVYLGLWIKILPASPIVAVKIAMIVLLGLVAVAYLKVLEALHAKWVWLSLALLPAMVSGQVYQRLIFVRPHIVSILILLAGLWAILKRKWWILGAISLIFAYSYSAPFLLPVIALLASAVFSVKEKKLVWEPFAFSLGGMVAGVVLNPYFPNNVHYLYAVTFKMAIRQVSLTPAELLPLFSWQVFSINRISFLMLFLSLLAVFYSERKYSANCLFLFFTCGLFFVLLMRSFRFIEYWPFMASLCVSVILGETFEKSPLAGRIFKKTTAALCGVAFLLIGAFQVKDAYGQARSLLPYASLKEVVDVLDKEADPGDIVYSEDWELTMPMFYISDKVHYLLMSDPEMMRMAYPGLYALWYGINTGRVSEYALPLIRAIEANTKDPEIAKLRSSMESGLVVDRLPDIIRSAFRAKWIILSHNHTGELYDLRPLMSRFPVDIVFVKGNELFSLYRLR